MEMFCEKTLFSLVFSRRGWFRVLASSGKVHWIRSERENREQNNTHTHKSTKEKHSFAFILLKFMQYKKGIEWTLAPNENNTNEANKQVTNSFLIKSQHQKEKLYLFIALLLLFFFSLFDVKFFASMQGVSFILFHIKAKKNWLVFRIPFHYLEIVQ